MCRDGRHFAVVARRSAVTAARTASALEGAYRGRGGELVAMIRRGEFPLPGTPLGAGRLAAGGRRFRAHRRDRAWSATPAPMRCRPSAARPGRRPRRHAPGRGHHRAGRPAAHRSRAAGPVRGRRPVARPTWRTRRRSLMARVIPLRSAAGRDGSLILLRDVTELRLRERELVSRRRRSARSTTGSRTTCRPSRPCCGCRPVGPDCRRPGGAGGGRAPGRLDRAGARDPEPVVRRRGRLRRDRRRAAAQRARLSSDRRATGGSVRPIASAPSGCCRARSPHRWRWSSPSWCRTLSRTPSTASTGGTVTLAVNRIRDRLRLRVTDDGARPAGGFDDDGSLGLSIVSTLVEGELGGSLAVRVQRQAAPPSRSR